MDSLSAGIALHPAGVTPEASMMAVKQALQSEMAIAQVVQAAQDSLPPPVDPAKGRNLDLLA